MDEQEVADSVLAEINSRPLCGECQFPMTRDRVNAGFGQSTWRCRTPGCQVAEFWSQVSTGELYADRSDYLRLFDQDADRPSMSQFRQACLYTLLCVTVFGLTIWFTR